RGGAARNGAAVRLRLRAALTRELSGRVGCVVRSVTRVACLCLAQRALLVFCGPLVLFCELAFALGLSVQVGSTHRCSSSRRLRRKQRARRAIGSPRQIVIGWN